MADQPKNPRDGFLYSKNNRQVSGKEFIGRALLEGGALTAILIANYIFGRRKKK